MLMTLANIETLAIKIFICHDILLYFLEQKEGIQQERCKSCLLQVQSEVIKAITTTLDQNPGDSSFEEIEMRCSFIATGTDAVLCTGIAK